VTYRTGAQRFGLAAAGVTVGAGVTAVPNCSKAICWSALTSVRGKPNSKAEHSASPSEHGSRLKRILFALPPASLRGHRVAASDRGILVVGSENLDVIPLGQLLCELTPGLPVPLGMDIVPRVSPDVLSRCRNCT
jgi:hypothetical protein